MGVEMNFRELVQKVARRGLKATDRPRSMDSVAKMCGFSKPHLYNLILGHRTPPPWTVARIAKAFKTTVETVRKALQESQQDAAKRKATKRKGSR
jgi:DNA-binding phage protein